MLTFCGEGVLSKDSKVCRSEFFFKGRSTASHLGGTDVFLTPGKRGFPNELNALWVSSIKQQDSEKHEVLSLIYLNFDVILGDEL